jgi:2'-5' RNA ligase
MPKFAVYFVPKSDESWAPHFTLLNPYSGPNADSLASALARLTEEFQEFTIDTVCLSVQERDGADWFIYREFFRN